MLILFRFFLSFSCLSKIDFMKTTSLRLRFWIFNYRIPLETRHFAVETCRKSGRLRRTKDEQPMLLTRKRRPRRGEEKERRSRLQRTWWPQMLEVGENRTETGPVAGSLLLPGYGASCWIRNESFWTIALNNVCVIEARVARGCEIFMTAAEGEVWLAAEWRKTRKEQGAKKLLRILRRMNRVSLDASSARYPESWTVLTWNLLLMLGERTNKFRDEDKWRIEIKLWMIIEILKETSFLSILLVKRIMRNISVFAFLKY